MDHLLTGFLREQLGVRGPFEVLSQWYGEGLKQGSETEELLLYSSVTPDGKR